MPAYLIYNQLISTIIMGKQDVPNLPLMIPTNNAHTSIMTPTESVLILRNQVILMSKWLIVGLPLLLIMAFTIDLVINNTHRIVISNRLQLTIHMDILHSIIRHLMLHTIIHVLIIRHLLLL